MDSLKIGGWLFIFGVFYDWFVHSLSSLRNQRLYKAGRWLYFTCVGAIPKWKDTWVKTRPSISMLLTLLGKCKQMNGKQDSIRGWSDFNGAVDWVCLKDHLHDNAEWDNHRFAVSAGHLSEIGVFFHLTSWAPSIVQRLLSGGHQKRLGLNGAVKLSWCVESIFVILHILLYHGLCGSHWSLTLSSLYRVGLFILLFSKDCLVWGEGGEDEPCFLCSRCLDLLKPDQMHLSGYHSDFTVIRIGTPCIHLPCLDTGAQGYAHPSVKMSTLQVLQNQTK